MKKVILAALASLTLATACKKDDTTTPAATMQLSGNLSAANSIKPTSASTATGTVTGTYDPTTNLLTYTLTYSGLTGPPTAGHFHYGDPKHTSSTFITFTNLPTTTSGTITGSATLTTTSASQPDSFKLGHVYANIHTSQYPAGEIRANVVVK
jgi:hypothetical protein